MLSTESIKSIEIFSLKEVIKSLEEQNKQLKEELKTEKEYSASILSCSEKLQQKLKYLGL